MIDAPPEGPHLVGDETVQRVEGVSPASVADRDGRLGRLDDVGEQHGGEHTVGLRRGLGPNKEPFDLGGHGVRVGETPVEQRSAAQLDVGGARNLLAQVAAAGGDGVVAVLKDERGDTDGRQELAHVGASDPLEDLAGEAGGYGVAEVPGGPVSEGGIAVDEIGGHTQTPRRDGGVREIPHFVLSGTVGVIDAAAGPRVAIADHQ